MMVVLENLWDKIVRNRERGIRTRIYIDEIYLLFRNEESANFLFELYKRARKWGGIPTGITQNVEDLLKSDTARSMLSNSEFILMLNQAASDREQLARILKIPDAMMKFVTGAPAGSGLIYCGLNGSLPFKDDFPTDSKLICGNSSRKRITVLAAKVSKPRAPPVMKHSAPLLMQSLTALSSFFSMSAVGS